MIFDDALLLGLHIGSSNPAAGRRLIEAIAEKNAMMTKANKRLLAQLTRQRIEQRWAPKLRRASMDRIVKAAAAYYLVRPEDLMGRSRETTIAEARHVAIFLMVQHIGGPLNEVATYMDRNHSTIHHSWSTIGLRREVSKDLDQNVREVTFLAFPTGISTVRPQNQGTYPLALEGNVTRARESSSDDGLI